jgi:hypothetical protein
LIVNPGPLPLEFTITSSWIGLIMTLTGTKEIQFIAIKITKITRVKAFAPRARRPFI